MEENSIMVDYFSNLSLLAIIGYSFIFILIIFTVSLAFNYFLYLIAKKAEIENPIFVWIPILNIIALTDIAQLPRYSGFLLFIPTINIFYFFYLLYKILDKFIDYPILYTLLLSVPIINFIILYKIAMNDNLVYRKDKFNNR